MEQILLERYIKNSQILQIAKEHQFARKKDSNKTWKLEEIKKGKNFKKRANTQKQVEIINLKSSLSNLQPTAVNTMSNVTEPPGEKRTEAKNRDSDSNGKSYTKVLINTSTA